MEIETDKANMTYDADGDGVLVEIVAQEGDTLPIGEVIARIGEASEVGAGATPAAAEAKEPKAELGRGGAPRRLGARRRRGHGGG